MSVKERLTLRKEKQCHAMRKAVKKGKRCIGPISGPSIACSIRPKTFNGPASKVFQTAALKLAGPVAVTSLSAYAIATLHDNPLPGDNYEEKAFVDMRSERDQKSRMSMNATRFVSYYRRLI